eukprot:CAMPEP_0194537098 /NCGR_PEP_ID=MMETSP0253-20130528/76261_1 /TAXON_ID=2966 /ORGANISM="Noctiluca scintillans" /LENGTH=103 /DNA_ID=CAMNT_0039383085 /DNA_START=104 /DNA_END=415 /DNA_ORIENTATION=+
MAPACFHLLSTSTNCETRSHSTAVVSTASSLGYTSHVPGKLTHAARLAPSCDQSCILTSEVNSGRGVVEDFIADSLWCRTMCTVRPRCRGGGKGSAVQQQCEQ